MEDSLKDSEIFGASKPYDTTHTRGEESNLVVVDGLGTPANLYSRAFEWEELDANNLSYPLHSVLDYDDTSEESILESQYFSSKKLFGSLEAPRDILIVRAEEIYLRELDTIKTKDISAYHAGWHPDYIGYTNYVGTTTVSGIPNGINPLPSFPWMGRGGDSGDGHAGGIGHSAGDMQNGRTYNAHGGAFICIVAKKVHGTGTISAKGGYSYYASGGGGILTIIAEEYSGTLKLNVAAGVSSVRAGKVGSIALVKKDLDGTETLMAYSQNGEVADLNGQTPVNGADYTIGWEAS